MTEHNLQDRTFLVTGANTGIGRATATELARRGGRVVLACRSEQKTRPVIDQIAQTTGNENLVYLPLDLADLASVRTAAETYLAGDEPLHVLIDNAGLAGQRGLTTDGFELAFGTNHLGHFLLTTLLLERLVASAPSRVVVVSSDSHYQAKGVDFEKVRRSTRTVSGMAEYAVSKLCNVLFAQELARRVDGTGVTTYSLHPGVIASDIWRRIPWPARPVVQGIMRMKPPAEGATTSLYCATAPELAGETGRYYDDCRLKEPSRAATPELAHELWSRSEEWISA